MPFRIRRLPTLASELSPDARSNYWIDFAACCLFSLFNVVNNQFYIPMAIDAGAGGIQVGLLTAAPAVGLLFSPLWASWIERTSSPKPFVIYPNLIGRLLLILPALFGFPAVFVTTWMIFYVLMGIQAPAYASLMTKVYPARYRGRIMGNVRTAMGVLMIPLAYWVGLWSDSHGSSGLLIAAAVTGAAAILLFARVRETEPAPPPRPVATRRTTIREQWRLVRENRELGVFLLASQFSGFANMLAQPLYQLIQMEVLELSFVQIGWTRTVYFACLLCAFFVIGILLDKYPPQRVIVCGLGAYAVVPFLYSVFGNYPAVLVASGIQGIGDAIWDIGILAYILRLAPGREAVAFGLHLLLFGIRGTIGPLLSTGLENTLPFSVMLMAAAIIAAIGTAIYIAGSRGQTQAAAVQAGR
jgi:MFS family permease